MLRVPRIKKYKLVAHESLDDYTLALITAFRKGYVPHAPPRVDFAIVPDSDGSPCLICTYSQVLVKYDLTVVRDARHPTLTPLRPVLPNKPPAVPPPRAPGRLIRGAGLPRTTEAPLPPSPTST